jgi:hypothetical protein
MDRVLGYGDLGGQDDSLYDLERRGKAVESEEVDLVFSDL